MINFDSLIPNDERLAAVAKDLAEFGKWVAGMGEKSIPPIANVVCIDFRSGEYKTTLETIIMDGFPDDPEKRLMGFHQLAMHIVAEQGLMPIAFVLACEAWVSDIEIKNDNEGLPDSTVPIVLPEDGDRFEAFVIQGMTISRRYVGAIYEMRRRHDETLALVESTKFNNFNVYDGKRTYNGMIAAFFTGAAEAFAKYEKSKGNDDSDPIDNS